MDEKFSAWRKALDAPRQTNTAKMTAVSRLMGIVLALLVAACAGPPKEAPPRVTTQSGPLTIDPSLAGPKRDVPTAIVADPREAAASPKAAVTPPPGAAVAPSPGTAIAAAAPPPSTASASNATPPPAKAAVKAPVAPPAGEKPAAKIEPPAAAVKKAAPPLDMAALKTRLRDTKSIGVFTKLTLKSQVDDLVQQFRNHYESGKSSNIGSLRQAYDMLVLKVLAVVQDNDPSLAREIAGSREAIWSILADREKFNSII